MSDFHPVSWMADRLAQIEARAQAATEGPWVGAWIEDFHIVYDDDSGEHVIAEAVDLADDAEFIAHARTDVPALVAALRAVLDLADQAMDGLPEDDDGSTVGVTVQALRFAIGVHLGLTPLDLGEHVADAVVAASPLRTVTDAQVKRAAAALMDGDPEYENGTYGPDDYEDMARTALRAARLAGGDDR